MASVDELGVRGASDVRFEEGFVEADDFRIRYVEAGQGQPLVVLHGAGGLRQSRSHQLLARSYRVILFEAPGFGTSPENTRSASMAELARTMAAAVGALGIQPYHLLGNSFGGRLALWLAVQFANRIQTLTLIAPAAIRLEGQPPLSPDERAKAMFAHPERLGPRPPEDPAVTAKQDALTRRLAGPPRDPELERRLAELAVPVLVLLGTEDRIVPKEVGRLYRELLPTSYVFFVYDAAHQVDVDRPEACAALIHDFVDRQEGFLVARRSGLLYP